MSPQPVRILLIDDHEIIREGLRALVHRVPGWSVVGEAEDGLEGIRLALVLRPDVVVTDMIMTGANGLEVARRLRAASFPGGLVLLSAHRGADLDHDAREVGINKVLTKQSSFGELSAAILEAAQQGSAAASVGPAAVREGEDRVSAIDSLTPREIQVLRLVGEGLSSKVIAGRLGISSKTVDVHRYRVQTKLRATGSSDLTRIAVRAGLASL